MHWSKISLIIFKIFNNLVSKNNIHSVHLKFKPSCAFVLIAFGLFSVSVIGGVSNTVT